MLLIGVTGPAGSAKSLLLAEIAAEEAARGRRVDGFVCSPDGRVIARAPAQQDAVLVADIDLGETSSSHARRLFMQHRRPELYADWVTGSPAD